jgi:IPT/TIG domain
MKLFEALAAGLAGIIVLFVAIWLVERDAPTTQSGHKWLTFLEGQDGRLSTSKFQWFVWTFVVVGGFCAVFAARGLNGEIQFDLGVSANILTALGFSTVTMATAKGITTLYVANGRVNKTAPTAGKGGGILVDDDQIADLSKIQLITWTIIAIGIWTYLVIARVAYITSTPTTDPHYDSLAVLPDIPVTLMVLMGLSQGGYLGKKLVSIDTVTLSALVPSTVQPGFVVTLYGSGFQEPQDPASAVLVGGLTAEIAGWSDGQVRFMVPAKSPDGNAWGPNESTVVTMVILGRALDQQLPLTVNGPPSGTSVPGS